MRGKLGILALIVIGVLLASTAAWSQEMALPLDKTIGSGITKVFFGGTLYTFSTQGSYTIHMETCDPQHVRLTLRPSKAMASPYPAVVVQWDTFGPQTLDVTQPAGNTFLLNTETGYAEK